MERRRIGRITQGDLFTLEKPQYKPFQFLQEQYTLSRMLLRKIRISLLRNQCEELFHSSQNKYSHFGKN